MNTKHFTYRVTWSPEDGHGETVPVALAVKDYSGEFCVRQRPKLAELLAATPENLARVAGWDEMPDVGVEL